MQILCKKAINKGDIARIRLLKEDVEEKYLWKAVICQAIDDATSNHKRRDYKYFKRRALKWLIEDNEDFTTVCDLAGYDPNLIRTNVMPLLEDVKSKAGCVPVPVVIRIADFVHDADFVLDYVV